MSKRRGSGIGVSGSSTFPNISCPTMTLVLMNGIAIIFLGFVGFGVLHTKVRSYYLVFFLICLFRSSIDS